MDLEGIAAVARRHGLPLVVDNTLASPALIRPIEHGADIVVHSTSKFLGGSGQTIGGVICDAGRFDWARPDRYDLINAPWPDYEGLVVRERFPDMPFAVACRLFGLRERERPHRGRHGGRAGEDHDHGRRVHSESGHRRLRSQRGNAAGELPRSENRQGQSMRRRRAARQRDERLEIRAAGARERDRGAIDQFFTGLTQLAEREPDGRVEPQQRADCQQPPEYRADDAIPPGDAIDDRITLSLHRRAQSLVQRTRSSLSGHVFPQLAIGVERGHERARAIKLRESALHERRDAATVLLEICIESDSR